MPIRASPYVARFMGGQNVLSGVVQSVAGGPRRASRAPVASTSRSRDEDSPPHGRSTVRFLRCAATGCRWPRPTPAVALGTNALSARVTMTEYQGIYVKVTLAIDLAPGQVNGADEFVAYVPEADFFASAIQIGDAVVASWQTGSVRILAGDANAFPRH